MNFGKTLLSAFAASLCLAVFVSCGTDETPTVNLEFDTEEVSFSDYDFDGYEFVIIGTTQGEEKFSLNPVYGDTDKGDKILQRYEETENTLNVEVTVSTAPDIGKIMQNYAAGLKYADLIFISLSDTLANGNIQKGLFNDLTELDLDLHSGKYGTSEMIKATTFMGGVYGFVSYYWGVPVMHTPHAMWYNPAVLTKYAQPTPHELTEQGKWNWDSLESICRAVRDDTDPEYPVYGMVYTSEQYLELSAIYANGGRLAEINDNGRLVYAMNSPNTIEALEWLYGLATEGVIIDGGDRQNIEPFMESRYAFFFEYPWMGLSTEYGPLAIKMESPYGWALFPTGPSGDPNAVPTVISYHSRFLMSPIGCDTEVLEAVMDFMFEPLDGETATSWYDSFSRMNFYDEDSFNVFVRMREESFWDYASYTTFTGTMRQAIRSVITGEKTSSQALTEIAESVQTNIDTYYNDYLD